MWFGVLTLLGSSLLLTAALDPFIANAVVEDGGLLTGGLSNTDFRTLEAVTGFYREYMDRVHQDYIQRYGKDSKQAEECFFGAHAEPHVSDRVLRAMLAAQPTLKLLIEHVGNWSSHPTFGTYHFEFGGSGRSDILGGSIQQRIAICGRAAA